ncbi:MAG: DUF4352 domain-containing protein [Clostridia bacterium]|nr:DUF4352 domain-containing protein [Clostridia bacterium]
MRKTISIIFTQILLLLCFSGCFLLEDDTNSKYVDNYSKSIPYINETLINVYGVEFKVNEVTNHDLLTNGYYEITTDANFVWITLEIYNGSNKTISINPNDFQLKKISQSGTLSYRYSSHTYSLPDYMTHTELGPELRKTFNILFEVPSKTTVDEYRLICELTTLSFDIPNDAVNAIILKNR